MNLMNVWGRTTKGYFECRRCGTTLEGSLDACPECGSDDVVHYPPSILE